MYDLTVFELDDQLDFDRFEFWLLNEYTLPPLTPISQVSFIEQYQHGIAYGVEKLSLPRKATLALRSRDGVTWASWARRPAEDSARNAVHFRTAIRPFIEDYDRLWSECVSELLDDYERLKSDDLDSASDFGLLAHFDEAWRVRGRMWDIHYYLQNGVFQTFNLFEDLCKELLFLDDGDPRFHKLVCGFDNKKAEGDRGLWQLARDATTSGLRDVFLGADPDSLLASLETTTAGRDWLERFRAYLDEYGWQSDNIFEFANPPWVLNPGRPLAFITQFIVSGTDFEPEHRRQELVREREQMVAEVLAHIPEDARETFRLLLACAQRADTFSEEHDFYFDLYSCALMHRALMGCGRRLVERGVTGRPEDVFFLGPGEIRKVMLQAWMYDMRPVVARRRAEWEAAQTREYPRTLGRLDFVEALQLLHGLRDPDDKTVMGRMPTVRPDLDADLLGLCGAPGVAEGPARIVRNADELGAIEKGDVLVAVNTSVSWTPIFPLLSGVVVDRGGSLSHAAVVCREYGIPCVVNVLEGTSKIRPGQRVRVDGDQGAVFLVN